MPRSFRNQPEQFVVVFAGGFTEEGGVQRSGKTVPAQDAILPAGQRHKASGGASPGAAPLEADPVDVDFDDELSSDEEFLLIEMEADDSGDDGAPMATPPRDLADGAPPGAAARGPSSPFEPAGEISQISLRQTNLICDCS